MTGAQCGNPARWDLCGGPSARTVPTATKEETTKFLMNECGLTEVKARLRALNNDVLVTQYVTR
jgi:hypothetical protein